MMSLNEAIKHCEEKIEECKKENLVECAQEHEQLKEWLGELEFLKKLKSYDLPESPFDLPE